MPSSKQHNEQAAPVPNPFSESAGNHGENPARFLVECFRLDDGSGTSGELILARIRGLESVALCRYWLAVERWLATEGYLSNESPRDRVVDALKQREAELEEDGLPQTAGLTPKERRERAAEYESESVAVLVDEDGNEVPWSRQEGATIAGVSS